MTEPTTTPPAPPDGMTRASWTYQGRRLTSDGKLAHYWTDPAGERRIFAKDLTASSWNRARPGARYLVWANDTQARLSGDYVPVFQGMVDDPAQITEWDAADRAAAAEARLIKEAKGALGHDYLAEHLEPLRAQYARSNRDGQAALLGLVIQTITSRRGRA